MIVTQMHPTCGYVTSSASQDVVIVLQDARFQGESGRIVFLCANNAGYSVHVASPSFVRRHLEEIITIALQPLDGG